MNQQRSYRSIIIPVLSVLALAAVLLAIPMPKLGRASQAFGDFFHAPLFALLAAFILYQMRERGASYLWLKAFGVWLFLGTLGVASELAQSHIGRTGNVHDMSADAAGAAAGLLCVMFWSHPRPSYRRGAAVVIVALILASYVFPVILLVDVYLAYRDMPVLASLENSTETMRWSPANAQLSRSQQYATEGQWSLKADLNVAEYSGATLNITDHDWTDFDQLVMDLMWVDPTVEADDRLRVVIKVQDVPHTGEHNDRFHQLVNLAPGQQQEIRIALADVAYAPQDRLMDMSRIKFVQIFTNRPKRPLTLYVDNMRLE
ncbi:MAG: VanZ family protein [Pirellulales bacterium]